MFDPEWMNPREPPPASGRADNIRRRVSDRAIATASPDQSALAIHQHDLCHDVSIPGPPHNRYGHPRSHLGYHARARDRAMQKAALEYQVAEQRLARARNARSP